MFRLLRVLDARTAAEDAAMLAAGYQIERTGRWARTYRPDPAQFAARRAEAERDRIAQMGRNAEAMHALAFPREHADMLARHAAQAAPTPAPLAPEQAAAALADRMDPDRIVFERLTIERGRQR
jgi:urease accessory protein UreF